MSYRMLSPLPIEELTLHVLRSFYPDHFGEFYA